MKRMVAGFLACAVAMTVVLPAVTARAAGYHEYEMEEYVMQEMDAANCMGIRMSVVSDEKEIYSAAFGADSQTGDDYVIGSLVQSMTALSILRMVEDDELQLKDTLSEYLSDYPGLQNVTIEELLTQTSGISMDAMSEDKNLLVEGTPGQFEESYAGYNLLGKVIETVSGETYEEYLTENILDACKMNSTYSLRQNPELSGQVKPVYQTIFGYPNKTKFQYREGQWADVSSGYLLSDVKDMGNYLQMYLKNDGEVVQQESVERMLQESKAIEEETPTNHLFGTEEAYTMGWISTKVEGTQIYYQMSCLADTMTYMLLVPDKNAGIVMMFNAADYMVGRKLNRSICAGVTRILLDQKPQCIKGGTYFKQHGTIDLVLLLLLIAAWMPILLIGVWGKRINGKFRVLRVVKDVILHLVLPTVLLVVLPRCFGSWRIWREYTPDLVYVTWAVIATLYLGAVIKLLQWGVVMLRRKLHAADEEEMQDPILPMVKSDTGVVGGFLMVDPLDDDLIDEEEEEEMEMEMEEEMESEEEEMLS